MIRKCDKCGIKIINNSFKNIWCPVCFPNKRNKNYKEHICIVCKTKFISNRPNHNFCSEDCKKKNPKKLCSLGQFYFIKVANNFTCKRCGQQIFPSGDTYRLHAHHKKPKSCGGTDSLENIICLCTGCHAFVHHYPKISKDFIDVPEDYAKNKPRK